MIVLALGLLVPEDFLAACDWKAIRGLSGVHPLHLHAHNGTKPSLHTQAQGVFWYRETQGTRKKSDLGLNLHTVCKLARMDFNEDVAGIIGVIAAKGFVALRLVGIHWAGIYYIG